MPDIRIVIADDHPVVRKGLRATIEQHLDLKVVGEAGDGRAALNQIRALQPDIALVDISMPELGGLELAGEIGRSELSVKIIFLTIHCDLSLLEKAVEAGARGYVLKDTAVGEIVDCIRRVAKGQFYASPALAGHFMERRRTARDRPRPDLATLTPAEKQVLKMIADYRTSSEIGEALHVSPRTVDTHRVNICNKLDLRGRHALMKFAIAHRSDLG
ncbi:MAG: response regulator transcription factor [Acidobacteriota bacterium]|nr:response regulator transcription factor [Acidobacteriota bacterium]